MKKKVLFISDCPPSNTKTSSVIFYRHFLLLEQKGFEINVITNKASIQSDIFPISWNIYVLPNRKFWYPPFRIMGILKWIRYYILYWENKQLIKIISPDIVIGFLHGFHFSGFSAFVANKIKRPLAVFYHDRYETLVYNNNLQLQDVVYKHNSYIINIAKTVWTISPDLIYHKSEWEDKFKVVYPIPEIIMKKAIWKDSFAKEPVVGYAGTLYPEITESMIIFCNQLKKVNGKLLILSVITKSIEKIIAVCNNVIIIQPKENTEIACNYLIENASSFIISYPEDINSMPWIDSCFPSKFTQFLQTGLPTFVIAPEKSAIAKWCRKTSWNLYSNNYESNNLLKLITKTSIENTWQECSSQSIKAANSEFSQHEIQKIVEQSIHDIFSEK